MSAYPNVDFGAFPPVAIPSESSRLSYTLAPVTLTDAAVTLTTGQVQNGTLNASAFTAGRVLTLPTAAALVASLSGALAGSTLSLVVVCNSGGAATLAVGTGGTALGNLVVLASTSGQFRVRLTNVSSGSEAYQLQRLA